MVFGFPMAFCFEQNGSHFILNHWKSDEFSIPMCLCSELVVRLYSVVLFLFKTGRFGHTLTLRLEFKSLLTPKINLLQLLENLVKILIKTYILFVESIYISKERSAKRYLKTNKTISGFNMLKNGKIEQLVCNSLSNASWLARIWSRCEWPTGICMWCCMVM